MTMQEEKYTLNVEVDKDNVKITNKEKIHNGEYKATQCVFNFSEDFDNLTKEAIFEAEDVIKEMPIINNKCDIPAEILSSNYYNCNLRVYGYDVEEVEGQMTVRLRYSPTYDEFPLWRGSYIPNAEQGEEITPTQFEQYLAALNEGLSKVKDGVGLEFNWEDTSLGVKREDEEEYQYTDLKGDKGDPGDTPDLSNYYTKSEIDNMIGDVESTLTTLDIGSGV